MCLIKTRFSSRRIDTKSLTSLIIWGFALLVSVNVQREGILQQRRSCPFLSRNIDYQSRMKTIVHERTILMRSNRLNLIVRKVIGKRDGTYSHWKSTLRAFWLNQDVYRSQSRFFDRNDRFVFNTAWIFLLKNERLQLLLILLNTSFPPPPRSSSAFPSLSLFSSLFLLFLSKSHTISVIS